MAGRERGDEGGDGARDAGRDAGEDVIECFECGQCFPRDQLEEVGDTVFCRTCHAHMLRRIDERRARGESSGPIRAGSSTGPRTGPTPGPTTGPTAGLASVPLRSSTGSTGPGGPLARPSAADAPCFVCGGPLDGETLFELRGFAICGHCARGLIGDEPPADDPAAAAEDAAFDEDDDDADDADDLLGDAPRPIAPEGSSRVVVTPGTGTEWCTGCRRPMPGPGSYQLVAGRPYCPGCVAARTRKTAPMRVPGDALDDDAAASPDACDACCRAIDPAAVPLTQGFRLCAACLHSDRELALAIARSRHQRRLARAGRRLLDGDDD
jgi:hypothetical protein